MIMKKMLCYMLSSVFLLAILSSCVVEEGEPPRLSDLAGTYTGNSKLDINFQLNPALAVNSNRLTDGAVVEFKDETADNLVITVRAAQLSTRTGEEVPVNGEFTFTISDLSSEEEDLGIFDDIFDVDISEIMFSIGGEGSASITAGSGATATSIDDLILTDVVATEATGSAVTLRANATIPQAGATTLIAAFDPSADAATEDVVVEIELSVERISDRSPAPILADLEGTYRGDSFLDLNFLLRPEVLVTSNRLPNGAAVEFKDAAEDNLVITLEDAQLSITGQASVDVDGVFTFTISNLGRALLDDDEIVFDIDGEGKVNITVGSGATAVSINDLALTRVSATETTADAVTLSGDATLTVAEATALIAAFAPTAPAPTTPVDVEITLGVEDIEEDTTP